jgi:hypothetical protein
LNFYNVFIYAKNVKEDKETGLIQTDKSKNVKISKNGNHIKSIITRSRKAINSTKSVITTLTEIVNLTIIGQ